MNRDTREVCDAVARMGCRVLRVATSNGGHLRLLIEHEGRQFTLFAPRKFSCPHSRNNFMADVRKKIAPAIA